MTIRAGCLIAVVLVFYGILFTDQSTSADNAPSQVSSSSCHSQNCVLRSPTRGGRVVVAISKQALEEMYSAGNDRAIALMVMNGSAFLVPQNTQVSVVDRSIGSRKVLVLNGSSMGQSGWVPMEWVVEK